MTSKKNIGGEMEIAPADFSASGTAPAWPEFADYEQVQCDTGRSALRLALADWQRKTNGCGRIWVPDYICPSIIELIKKQDVPSAFYVALPKAETLTNPPSPEDDDLVLIVHYFGKINTAALAWVATIPERRWYVLEDCVQSPYSEGAGRVGEYCIASLRKWWPVPDGALLFSTKPLLPFDLDPPDESFIGQRLAAQILRVTGRDESLYLDWIHESEEKLAASPPRRCSWLSGQLLSSVNRATALKQRRLNWQSLHSQLAEELEQFTWFSSLYDSLLPGEVPLTYPVLVSGGRRDNLREWLITHQIYCPIHWRLVGFMSIPAKRLSEEILSFPIDQRYGDEDMGRIVGALAKFAKMVD